MNPTQALRGALRRFAALFTPRRQRIASCALDALLIAVACAWLWRLRGLRERILPPDLWRPLGYIMFCAFSLLTASVIVLLRVAFLRGRPAHRLFLLVYIPASLAMMLLLPVGRVPDEPAHLERVYLISSGQLLPPSDGSGYALPANFMRWQTSETYSLTDVAHDLSLALDSRTARTSGGEATGIYPIDCYFPQALCMAIAHLFTDNWAALLYAARLGGWLATAFLLYHAIRIAPTGKALIMLIALFPMSLQEAISASADGLALGAAVCFTAYVLRAADGRAFTRRSYAALFVLSFCVATFKVMYAPLLLLLPAIPSSCFGSRRKKRVCLTLLLLGMAALLGGWAALCYARYAAESTDSLSAQVVPQLQYILHNPLRFLRTAARTLRADANEWIGGIFGAFLSWLNIPIPEEILRGLSFVFLWALAALAVGRALRRPARDGLSRMRAALLLSVFASVCVIFLFLYAWWTPYGEDVVLGIQGRYFLPLLFPLCVGLFGHAGEAPLLTRLQLRRLQCAAVLDAAALAAVLYFTIV